MRSRALVAALCVAVLGTSTSALAVRRPPDPCDYDPNVQCPPNVGPLISNLYGILCQAQINLEVTEIRYVSDVGSYDVLRATGGGACPLDHQNDELEVEGAVAVFGSATPEDPGDFSLELACSGNYGACTAVIDGIIAEPGPVTVQSAISPTHRVNPFADRKERTYLLRQAIFEA